MMLPLALLLALQAPVDAGPPAVPAAPGPFHLVIGKADVTALPAGAGRSTDELHATLSHVTAVQACPIAAAVAGTFDAALVVRADGTVSSALVGPQKDAPASSDTAALRACLTSELSSARFPANAAPEQTVNVKLHLVAGARPPVVKGSLDKEIIRKVVQANASAIRACHEGALTTAPGLAGTVKMKWVIGPEGNVTQTQVESAAPGFEAVTDCLRTEIGGWRFPKPKGKGIVIVSYPLQFKRAP